MTYPESSISTAVPIKDFLFQNSNVHQPEIVRWETVGSDELNEAISEGSYDVDSIVFAGTAFDLFTNPTLKSQLSSLHCKVFR